MKKFFGKFPIVAIAVIVGVCSVSLTAYAYYRLTLAVDVSAIQTASCSMLVKVITSDTQAVSLLDEEESYIESYKFTGKEGESGVTFCIIGAGTASSGYCEVIVDDQSYYTPTIAKGESYYFTIKGNKDTEVQFLSHWGKHDITDETQLISRGEKIGIFVPVATASPSPSATLNPCLTPSATPSASPSPSATPDLSASPEASASPSPSVTPEVSASPSPTPTPEVSASPEPSPTPEVDASITPSSSPEVTTPPSATISPSTDTTPSPTPENSTGVGMSETSEIVSSDETSEQ